MKFKKEEIIEEICRIREEIGHRKMIPSIKDVIYSRKDDTVLIITYDRPEKSIVIGKGGWVVGKLKESLNISSIHVEAYPDILLREYKVKLGYDKLKHFLKFNQTGSIALNNLCTLLKERLLNIYDFEAVLDNMQNLYEENDKKAVVALSGGVDSSFSLIVSKKMGFNPVAVTVDPGSIILPKYFKQNVEKLSHKINVEHHYIPVKMDDIIKDTLEGRFHPCGRCSKVIEKTVLDYAKEIGVPFLIYGDLLSTGSQSIVQEGEIIKINLPAMLSVTKGEIKKVASKYDILKKRAYGCPLINEVHKKHPHMKKFSLQRILRETRAGILEPGEALEMIMKTI